MTNPNLTPDETPDGTPAPIPDHIMVRQAHGGMLKRGGRNPNSGRTPSVIKAKLRRDFMEVAPLLKEFAKGKNKKGEDIDIKMADRIRAIDVIAKHGLDHAVTLTDVREALRQTREVIGEHMDREHAEALWSMIIPFWLAL